MISDAVFGISVSFSYSAVLEELGGGLVEVEGEGLSEGQTVVEVVRSEPAMACILL